MTANPNPAINSTNSTAARKARRTYRKLAIAGLAGVAVAISVLTPTGAASAHGDDAHSVIAAPTTTTPARADIAIATTTTTTTTPASGIGFDQLAIDTPGLTPDQFVKWDRARTSGPVPALQTPAAVVPGRTPGGKTIAPRTDNPGDRVLTPSTTVASVTSSSVQAHVATAGSVLAANPGTLGSGSDCFVDFDEKSVLNILPNHAHATFVEWPYWLKECAGNQGNIAIQPQEDVSHYHLGYEDLQISFCSDIGNFGRHTEPRPVNPTDDELIDWYYTPCTEIDPVAETRSAIQPHGPGYTTSIFAYESFGGKLPMTLDSIQIVSGTSEICWLPTGEWVTQQGGGGSPWQCMELGAGYWNMSNIADDVTEVRVTAVTPNNVIDNIAADIL